MDHFRNQRMIEEIELEPDPKVRERLLKQWLYLGDEGRELYFRLEDMMEKTEK